MTRRRLTPPTTGDNGAEVAELEFDPAQIEEPEADLEPETAKAEIGKKIVPAEHVVIPKLIFSRVQLRIVGVDVLVVHRFTEKAKQELRDKHGKKAKSARPKRNPKQEFNQARYVVRGKDCIPTMAIKKAMVSACGFVQGLSKTLVRSVVRINPGNEFSPLEHDAAQPTMREDAVRVGGRGPGTGRADLRYRPQYTGWSVPIVVRFVSNFISAEQVMTLLSYACELIGFCEQRAEKGGDWGCAEVMTEQQFQASRGRKKGGRRAQKAS